MKRTVSLPSFPTSFIWHGKWLKASRDAEKRGEGAWIYCICIFPALETTGGLCLTSRGWRSQIKASCPLVPTNPLYVLPPTIPSFPLASDNERLFVAPTNRWRPYRFAVTIAPLPYFLLTNFFFLVDIFSVHPIFMVGQLRFGFSDSTICIQQCDPSPETCVQGRVCVWEIRADDGAAAASRTCSNIAIRLKIHWRYFHINGILSHDWVLSDPTEINLTAKYFLCVSL